MTDKDRIDDTFFSVLCREYLKQKSKEDMNIEETKEIGCRIGYRLSEDFFLHVDSKKIYNLQEAFHYLKEFFRIYFSYEIQTSENFLIIGEGFAIKDRLSLIMISGIIEHIFSYLIDGKLEVILVDHLKYEISLKKT